MTTSSGNKPAFLARLLPDIRIYLKTEDDRTRYLKLTTRMQASALAVGMAAASWTIVSTSALMLGMMSTDDAQSQSEVIHKAYEQRIAELSQERDQRQREASAIQSRFQLALSEIAEQKQALMERETAQFELKTELGLMRRKFGQAVAIRDSAMEEADDLSIELAKKTAIFSENAGAATDLTDTLETISLALSDTTKQRDETNTQLQEMASKIAELEFRARVNADKQERVFTQLEGAVAVALDPLEKLLKSSGKDVDQLLSQVKAQYSGQGGPFVPASLPKASEDDPAYRRYASLMEGLDQVHLMQLAASQIPFASPVKNAVRYTSGFGRRVDPINGRGRMHNGQDLAGKRGTPILATADGTVIFAGRQSGYGNVVKIRHAFGYETVYAHMNSIKVKVGQSVSRGDQIGGMGNTGRSTGVHLHYEIRIGGDPTNPMPYMKAARDVF